MTPRGYEELQHLAGVGHVETFGLFAHGLEGTDGLEDVAPTVLELANVPSEFGAKLDYSLLSLKTLVVGNSGVRGRTVAVV